MSISCYHSYACLNTQYLTFEVPHPIYTTYIIYTCDTSSSFRSNIITVMQNTNLDQTHKLKL